MIAAIRRSISAGSPFRPIVLIALGLAVLIAALALYAGQATSHRFVGHWLGNRHINPQLGQSAPVMYTIGRVEIWIQDNGTFLMSEGGIPLEGLVRYEDGKALLKIKTRFGQPIEAGGPGMEAMNAEISLEPQKDGTVLFNDPKGFDKPFKLTRQPQPTR